MSEKSAKSTRVSGWKCRTYVQNKQPFHNSNKQLYGKWVNSDRYVVYSYGAHWPLLVWDESVGRWFANYNKTSRTTTKHASQTHPLTELHPLSLQQIQVLAERGFQTLAANRIGGFVV